MIPPSTIRMELQRVGKGVYGEYVGSVEMFLLIQREHGGGTRMLALSLLCSDGVLCNRMKWRYRSNLISAEMN